MAALLRTVDLGAIIHRPAIRPAVGLHPIQRWSSGHLLPADIGLDPVGCDPGASEIISREYLRRRVCDSSLRLGTQTICTPRGGPYAETNALDHDPGSVLRDRSQRSIQRQ